LRPLYLVINFCWLLLILVWFLGWLYNVARARRVVRGSSNPAFFGLQGSLAVVVVVFLLQRFVPMAVWRSISFWNPVLAVAGSIILVVSTLFTLWSRWTLGTMWTARPSIKEQHELRTDGPYHITRHPIYTGLMGMLLGTMLAAGFGGLLVAFVVAGLYCAFKIRTEESLLIETFGDRYRVYKRQVPAILPLPRHLYAPATTDGPRLGSWKGEP
jgi:protein-S-isoprenylcysteine O-methyltransferase Ste14